MNYELKNKIEELGWFISKKSGGWYLSKYSPAGEDFGFYVSEENFLDDLKLYIDNFDVDDHVRIFVDVMGQFGVHNSFKVLVKDAEDIETMLIELYNEIKNLEVFNGHTREESKEEN